MRNHYEKKPKKKKLRKQTQTKGEENEQVGNDCSCVFYEVFFRSYLLLWMISCLLMLSLIFLFILAPSKRMSFLSSSSALEEGEEGSTAVRMEIEERRRRRERYIEKERGVLHCVYFVFARVFAVVLGQHKRKHTRTKNKRKTQKQKGCEKKRGDAGQRIISLVFEQ